MTLHTLRDRTAPAAASPAAEAASLPAAAGTGEARSAAPPAPTAQSTGLRQGRVNVINASSVTRQMAARAAGRAAAAKEAACREAALKAAQEAMDMAVPPVAGNASASSRAVARLARGVAEVLPTLAVPSSTAARSPVSAAPTAAAATSATTAGSRRPTAPAVQAPAGRRAARPPSADAPPEAQPAEAQPPAGSAPDSTASAETSDVQDGAKNKGKGKSWSPAERKALAKAFAVATLNGISGADQTTPEFWQAVHEGFVTQMPANLSSTQRSGRWNSRTFTALQTEFQRNVGPCSQRYAHFYFVASSDNLTGNLDEEGVKRAARALYSASSAYAAARKDSEEEEKLSKAGKALPERRARSAPENWQPCWEDLKVLDKWSGAAANPDITALVDDELEADDSAVASSPLERGKRPPLQARPALGRKNAKHLAKEEKIADDALAEALAESSEAVKIIADSVAKRAAQAEAAQVAENRRVADEYFNRSDVRDTPEAAAFRSQLHAEMVALGRSALQRTREGLAAAATRPTSTPENEVGSQVPPRTAASVAANKARGTNAMATKARLARAQMAPIDLTQTAGAGRAADGPPRVAELGQGAPSGVPATVEITEALESDREDDEE